MGARTAGEIRGFEFDWLATDVDGHVALFSTAGGGYAPEEFLRDTDQHDKAIHALLDSEGSTAARFAPELPPGSKNTWKMVAERGLFAFDSDAYGGPYRLVAAPEAPIHVTNLPAVAAEVAARLPLRNVRFAGSAVLSADDLRAANRA